MHSDNLSNTKTLSEQSKELLSEQIKEWDLAKNNYIGLESVKVKEFLFDGFTIKVQFNPSRMISTSAKVDAKSIKERKCFLCPANLPQEQKGISFNSHYLILVNPFPIFPEHFTIPKVEHVPQRIKENFTDILDLSKDLCDRYAVFYNGPKCGASAPDHMHFQAGLKSFMPIDNEFDNLNKILIKSDDDVKTSYTENYLRNFISIEGNNKESIVIEFNRIYNALESLDNTEEEPMLNLIALFQNESWRIIIFPREKHRPAQYFEENENQILLSPASVDLGGICITPREEDFNKITKEIIENIFNQVSISKEKLEQIVKLMR